MIVIIVWTMVLAILCYLTYTSIEDRRKKKAEVRASDQKAIKAQIEKERSSLYEVVQHAEERAEIEYYRDHPEEKPKSPWPYVNITGIPDDFTVITNEVHIVLAAQPGVNLDLTWEGVPEARWVREDTENSTIFRLERKDR